MTPKEHLQLAQAVLNSPGQDFLSIAHSLAGLLAFAVGEQDDEAAAALRRDEELRQELDAFDRIVGRILKVADDLHHTDAERIYAAVDEARP